MTQEQIDKECDALIKAHYEMNRGTKFDFAKENKTILYALSFNSAILHQTGIVETLNNLHEDIKFHTPSSSNVIHFRHLHTKQILETLKSRVK